MPSPRVRSLVPRRRDVRIVRWVGVGHGLTGTHHLPPQPDLVTCQPRRCLKRTAQSYALCALRSGPSQPESGWAALSSNPSHGTNRPPLGAAWSVVWWVVCCMLHGVVCCVVCCMLHALLHVACSVPFRGRVALQLTRHEVELCWEYLFSALIDPVRTHPCALNQTKSA